MRGMLTVTEFCARYGVGRTRLYELMKSGELDSRVFGRRRLITLESALAWSAGLPKRWEAVIKKRA
jgi:excisionase family DNA binding protein